MKILITGGTGFIGKPVIHQLINAGHSLMALSRSAAATIDNNIQWVNSSLELNEAAISAITGFGPEVVIHLAWENIPDFSFETSYQNLQHQIQFFKNIGNIFSVRKIIVAGSCFEYNQQFGECLESDLCISTNYFTWAKNTVRDFLQFTCAQKGISFIWARIFYVYGPEQRSSSLIPSIIRNLQEGKIPDIRKPTNANDFIYVDDVAAGLKKMAENDIPSGIFNLGSGSETAVIDILRVTERLISKDETITGTMALATQQIPRETGAWAGMKKTSEILNWVPATSLEEGIRKTIEKR